MLKQKIQILPVKANNCKIFTHIHAYSHTHSRKPIHLYEKYPSITNIGLDFATLKIDEC